MYFYTERVRMERSPIQLFLDFFTRVSEDQKFIGTAQKIVLPSKEYTGQPETLYLPEYLSVMKVLPERSQLAEALLVLPVEVVAILKNRQSLMVVCSFGLFHQTVNAECVGRLFPGLQGWDNLFELAKAVGIELTKLQYPLRLVQKTGLIRTAKRGARYKHYYYFTGSKPKAGLEAYLDKHNREAALISARVFFRILEEVCRLVGESSLGG